MFSDRKHQLYNWIDRLPKEVADSIHSCMVNRTYSNGDLLHSQGECYEFVYQVIQGKVKVCHYGLNGEEFIINIIGSGDCCGDTGLIAGEPAMFSSIARGNVEVKTAL